MRKSIVLAATFTALSLLLTGCASSLTGDSYSRDDARKVQTIRMGTIESLRPVRIEGTKTPIGAGAGALLGGATTMYANHRKNKENGTKGGLLKGVGKNALKRCKIACSGSSPAKPSTG